MTNFNPIGSCYKPFKIECRRQGIQLKLSERIRYYLLSLTLSATSAVPLLPSLPALAIRYFSFMLKYLLSYPNSIQSCPRISRFLDFLNGSLNSASASAPLEELVLLIEECIQYTERADFIHTILTANPETFPIRSLAPLSSLKLE